MQKLEGCAVYFGQMGTHASDDDLIHTSQHCLEVPFAQITWLDSFQLQFPGKAMHFYVPFFPGGIGKGSVVTCKCTWEHSELNQEL